MNNTVLYIEDNEDNIRLVERLLTKRRPGITLVVATNGQDGLRLARDTTPDLILLDRRLPDMLGNEVLSGLKAETGTAAIPVVVLSGDSAADQAAETLRLGAVDFLPKPFEFQQLLTIIDRFGPREPLDG
jgi:two-component system, cell cycle response regulator DivK